MSKLLAGEYEKQWYSKRAEMTYQSDTAHGKPETVPAVGTAKAAYSHQK